MVLFIQKTGAPPFTCICLQATFTLSCVAATLTYHSNGRYIMSVVAMSIINVAKKLPELASLSGSYYYYYYA